MLKNPAVSNLIRRDNINQIDSLLETSIDQGMQSMTMHLDMLVQSGKITAEEAKLRTPRDKQLNY